MRQASTVFVSGLLYTLTAAVSASSAAMHAGGVVWSATWASQSTTVGFDWCVCSNAFLPAWEVGHSLGSVE